MIVIGACLAGLLLLVANPYRVHGQSMAPSLQDGKLVILDKVSYKFRSPKAGEVVVAHTPLGIEVVKRIIKETAPGKYWLEGDNKEASTDSREFGPVGQEAIVGRVLSL